MRNHPGNLLRIDGHPDWNDVEISWHEDRRLTITYRESRRVYKQETRFRHWLTAIDVQYEILTPDQSLRVRGSGDRHRVRSQDSFDTDPVL